MDSGGGRGQQGGVGLEGGLAKYSDDCDDTCSPTLSLGGFSLGSLGESARRCVLSLFSWHLLARKIWIFRIVAGKEAVCQALCTTESEL